jgi:hypothetical protein
MHAQAVKISFEAAVEARSAPTALNRLFWQFLFTCKIPCYWRPRTKERPGRTGRLPRANCSCDQPMQALSALLTQRVQSILFAGNFAAICLRLALAARTFGLWMAVKIRALSPPLAPGPAMVHIGGGRLAKDVPLANRVRSGRKQP